MTVEDLLAKKLSNEIDIEILIGVMKSANVPDLEIEEHVNILRKNLDNALDREFFFGKEQSNMIDRKINNITNKNAHKF